MMTWTDSLVAGALALFFGHALAQSSSVPAAAAADKPPAVSGVEDLGSIKYEDPALEYEWKRPEQVRFALLIGCGGGGGGGASLQNHAGGGGEGARVSTYLLGPLKDDVYKIRLGKGGDSAAAGADTTFEAEGTAVRLRGARAGRGASLVGGYYIGAPRTGSEAAYGGAGGFNNQPAETGGSSETALGGSGGSTLSGGGGGAGLEAGGAGGAQSAPGSPGGRCAGGGGGGGLANVGGGRGGDGFLRILPVYNTAVELDRTSTLLESLNAKFASIEALQKRIEDLEAANAKKKK